jgi:hypothetical protein
VEVGWIGRQVSGQVHDLASLGCKWDKKFITTR